MLTSGLRLLNDNACMHIGAHMLIGWPALMRGLVSRIGLKNILIKQKNAKKIGKAKQR